MVVRPFVLLLSPHFLPSLPLPNIQALLMTRLEPLTESFLIAEAFPYPSQNQS